MMKHSVVTIFKNNADIGVTASDINLIVNFTHIHSILRKEKQKEDQED